MAVKVKINYDETILNAAQNQGVVLESQCQNGYCGNCRCKLKKGEVKYDETPLAMTRGEDILPCVAKVTSDLAVIETQEGQLLNLSLGF